ncbi:hypothetical protein [Alkalicoccobacillus plakortidis]|nr:hypothetical protein [Alkalicoccobacillus plakortidis]
MDLKELLYQVQDAAPPYYGAELIQAVLLLSYDYIKKEDGD